MPEISLRLPANSIGFTWASPKERFKYSLKRLAVNAASLTFTYAKTKSHARHGSNVIAMKGLSRLHLPSHKHLFTMAAS